MPRHRIFGIDSGEDYQIVYSDTPGLIRPKYRLHRKMVESIDSSLEDADLIKIRDVNYTDPRLALTLGDYQQQFDGNAVYGEVRVKIHSVNSRGKSFDYEKTFRLPEKEMRISLRPSVQK